MEYEFLPNILLTPLFDQTFSFERASDIAVWQFNRAFYCIIDHDNEVSCVGFLFGTSQCDGRHLSGKRKTICGTIR
jgi:hypothetical protein